MIMLEIPTTLAECDMETEIKVRLFQRIALDMGMGMLAVSIFGSAHHSALGMLGSRQ